MTSSITNSCPSIGCRYIQTLPRKGQSLCRPLCRPRAFLLLSLSTAAAAAPPSFAHPLSFSRLLLLHLLSSSVSFLFRGKGRTAFLCRWKMRPRRGGRRRRERREWIRKKERERKVENEGGWNEKKDRMSEESVMRSLNTDAARVRYIAGKGETKKTRSRWRERKRWRKRMRESSSMNWMGRGSSTRKELAIGPSQPAIRFLRREILQF